MFIFYMTLQSPHGLLSAFGYNHRLGLVVFCPFTIQSNHHPLEGTCQQ